MVQLSPADIESINESCKGLRCRYCDFSDFSEWLAALLKRVLTVVVGYKYYDGLDDSD